MVNWNTNQPIILHLRQWIPHYFPEIPAHVRGSKWIHPTGVGGYSLTNPSVTHQEGRAADIYVNVNRPNLRRIGDGLFRIFSEHPDELGVENVTWDGKIWAGPYDPSRQGHPPDPPGRPREYTRGDHDNHLHVSFTRPGSQLQPGNLPRYFADLSAELRGTSEEYVGGGIWSGRPK